MSKIIDLGLDVPLTVQEAADKITRIFLPKDARGLANYRRIYGLRWAAAMGTSLEEIDQKRKELPEAEFIALLCSFAEMLTTSPEMFMQELDRAGIEWGLLRSGDYRKTAEFVGRWPERFKGLVNLNPFEGMQAVKELERAVRELGMAAFYASPFAWKIKADNSLFYPFYAKCVELHIPVFIYTAMNYNTELPMDLARPLYLDAVAMAFPKLKIVADCGGWPWVPEIVGVARRHQNVYIDTCSTRPKHLATPGSGWETLLQFGNTLLQDQVVFASGASDLGLSVGMIIEEVKSLPLKDQVKEKWLYKNAVRLFSKEA